MTRWLSAARTVRTFARVICDILWHTATRLGGCVIAWKIAEAVVRLVNNIPGRQP